MPGLTQILFLTAGLLVVVFWWVVIKNRDTLHPVALVAPMCFFVYVVQPSESETIRLLLWYFRPSELELVAWLNLAVVGALLFGMVLSGHHTRPAKPTAPLSPTEAIRLFRTGVAFALIGLVTYAYLLANVGGFGAAYATPKGGGTAASGYLRDPFYLIVPGVAAILMAGRNGRRSMRRAELIAGLAALPFLAHALLSSRRGPTFLVFVTISVAWFFANDRKPRRATLLVGGSVLGLLLFSLLTFRNDVYLGSTILQSPDLLSRETLVRVLDRPVESSHGTEFAYGANVILSRQRTGDHFWGRRYAATVFVRPIPGAFWPDKYANVGIPEYRENVGLLENLVMPAPSGAAPGVAGDLFAEFSFGAVAAAFGIGLLLGRAWRRAMTGGVFHRLTYVCVAASSLFLIAQTVVAFIFYFLVMWLPIVVAWPLLVRASGLRREWDLPRIESSA